MKIIIVTDHQIVGYGLRLISKSVWPVATVFELSDLYGTNNFLSEDKTDLIIIDLSITENKKLQDFLQKVGGKVKVIIFSNSQISHTVAKSLIAFGANGIIDKNSSVLEATDLLAKLFI